MMGSKFMEGAAVEVKVPDEHCCDVWFPATILKEIDKDFFLVEYNSLSIDDKEYLQDNVDALNIRPFPPVTLVESFNVFERVDAFFDFGWWNGVVLEVLPRDSDKDYMVCFEHEQNLKKIKKIHLRRYLQWINGQWLEDSLDLGTEHDQSDVHRTDNIHISRVNNTSNTIIASKSCKRKRDNERNANSTANSTKCKLLSQSNEMSAPPASVHTTEEKEPSPPKKRDTCKKLAGCLSSPSHELSAPSASVRDRSCSNQDDSSRTLVKCSQRDMDSEENEQHKEVVGQQAATTLEGTIEQLEELISESADGGPRISPRKQLESPSDREFLSHVEIPRSSEELRGPSTSISPEKIETVSDHDSSCNDQKEGETGDSSGTLLKCLQNLELRDSMRILGSGQEINLDTIKSNVAMSMENFGLVSQAPHFQPLQDQPGCFREGRAIGYKLCYLDLIDKIKTSQIHEPKIKLEKKLEALLKLETVGFDVQLIKPWVADMITLKDRQVRVEGMLKKYEEKVVEVKQSGESIMVELNAVNERVGEINENLLEMGRNLKVAEMENKKKGDRVTASRRKVEELKESVKRSRDEFTSVATLPLV
ncbi:hypothetical protein ACHQM5_004591 [Ranunculus cassubicifolius]